MQNDQAFRLSTSLKNASDASRSMKKAGEELVKVLTTNSPEIHKTIRALEEQLGVLKNSYSEVDATIAKQAELMEDLPGLQRTIDNAATLARNFQDVFVKSDPDTIQAFLQIADREPRRLAASSLDPEAIQGWIEDLENVLYEKAASAANDSK